MTFYISPYRRMTNLRHAMDRLLEESLNEAPSAEREMALAVDVCAQDDDYLVRALVPGLTADEVSIEILNNTITLRGEFKPAEGEKDYLMTELPTGKFSRVITLPTALDAAKAEANIRNGVLNLRVPKAETHRPKTIKISAN